VSENQEYLVSHNMITLEVWLRGLRPWRAWAVLRVCLSLRCSVSDMSCRVWHHLPLVCPRRLLSLLNSDLHLLHVHDTLPWISISPYSVCIPILIPDPAISSSNRSHHWFTVVELDSYICFAFWSFWDVNTDVWCIFDLRHPALHQAPQCYSSAVTAVH